MSGMHTPATAGDWRSPHATPMSAVRPTPPGPEMQEALRQVVAQNLQRMKRIGEIRPNQLAANYERFLKMGDASGKPYGPKAPVDLIA